MGDGPPGRRSHDAGAGGSPGRGSRHVETLEWGSSLCVESEFPSAPEALVERSRSGRGQVIDAAMVDGANYTVLSALGGLALQLTVRPSRRSHFSSGCKSGLVPAETRDLHFMTAGCGSCASHLMGAWRTMQCRKDTDSHGCIIFVLHTACKHCMHESVSH